jgi:hypothetical protein
MKINSPLLRKTKSHLHIPASISALATSFRTLFTVFIFMLPTFSGAGIAKVGA